MNVQERIRVNDSTSNIEYEHRTELDYGTLLCLAENTVSSSLLQDLKNIKKTSTSPPVFTLISIFISTQVHRSAAPCVLSLLLSSLQMSSLLLSSLLLSSSQVGSQETPCVFHVVPAGRPDPVTNCTVLSSFNMSLSNMSSSNMSLLICHHCR